MSRRMVGAAGLVACALALGLGGPALAQRQVVGVDPLGLVVGVIDLTYERVRSPGSSVEVSGQIVSLRLEPWTVTGFGARVSYRLYPRQQAPHGFFYGPFATGASIRVAFDDGSTREETSGTVFAVGALAGYQWVTEGGFAVNVLAQVGATMGRLSAAGREAPVQSVASGVGLMLGYAW